MEHEVLAVGQVLAAQWDNELLDRVREHLPPRAGELVGLWVGEMLDASFQRLV